MLTAHQFFQGLVPALTQAGFHPTKANDTAWNVYSPFKPGCPVFVTVNYAEAKYVSVKLTIQRKKQGGPTPVFDAVNEEYKHHEDALDGDVCWTWDSRKGKQGKHESKVVVKSRALSRSQAQINRWVLDNARVLKEWADYAATINC